MHRLSFKERWVERMCICVCACVKMSNIANCRDVSLAKDNEATAI